MYTEWGKLRIIVMIVLNATVPFCTVNLLKYDNDAILQHEFSKQYDIIYGTTNHRTEIL